VLDEVCDPAVVRCSVRDRWKAGGVNEKVFDFSEGMGGVEYCVVCLSDVVENFRVADLSARSRDSYSSAIQSGKGKVGPREKDVLGWEGKGAPTRRVFPSCLLLGRRRFCR
jgi:hypothetical protein